ncbi:MAG: elongation factor G [Endomicrobiales bacterium]|nr:elongation factor G [Endomicrobiales bacterium]
MALKKYETKDLRNICLVGAQGDGKTSLGEVLLFNAKVTNRLGSIDEGNTVLDNTEDEIERKTSISLSVAFCEHNNCKINILNTPGYGDFIGEVCAALAVAESSVFVISADSGVNPVCENLWGYLENHKMPTVIFLNKLDKENLNFEQIIAEIKEKLNHQVAVINLPEKTGEGFSSLVNIFEGNVPESAVKWNESLIESISSSDDSLTEKYLEGKEITKDELKAALTKAIMERKVFPVLCGSAAKNIGIKELADFIVNYLPAPEVANDNAHLGALVYKTVSEPGMGQLNFVKLISGTLEAGKDIFNFTKNTRERIGQLCYVQGKKRIDAAGVSIGDLVSLVKLKDTKTNDILGDEKNQPDIKQIAFPETLYQKAIVTKSKGDSEKVGNALALVIIENPTIHYFFNGETKEMILAGVGSLQLEVVMKKIRNRYGVDVELHSPRVPYKETIHGKSEVQGKYKRQSGGRGQYGDCWLKLEPLARSKGFEFINKIVGGAIPKNYIPAIEKGVKEAMDQGVIAGYPVVDVQVTVFDGSYHEVDSSDMAFKIAGAMALRKGVSEARPAILEPIVNLEVTIPDGYMGTIMGDLNSRRGRVLGMEKVGKKELVKAQIPMGEIFEYATELRSLTKGSGEYTMKFSHYEEAPPQIAQPLVDAYRKAKEAEVAAKQ